MRAQRGATLIELLTVVGIIGVIAGITLPAFSTYRRHNSILVAANEFRGIFRLVRSRAIAKGRHAGVKFVKVNSTWTYSLYDDGNGDGIRNADINKGIDRKWAGPFVVGRESALAKVALPPYVIRDPDGDLLHPTDSAVQFGNSTICSFAPVGNGTPGSIYLVDGSGEIYCVRVYGSLGKVRMLRYNGGRRKWEER
jgi:prepilin-type N-terminal cleavage/methylation domain-containing protein